MENDLIEYLAFQKSSHPNLLKYSRKLKLRKVDSNIVNMYDIGMKSLLTSGEISKRAELFAKLYMKFHYDGEKYKNSKEGIKKADNEKTSIETKTASPSKILTEFQLVIYYISSFFKINI